MAAAAQHWGRVLAWVVLLLALSPDAARPATSTATALHSLSSSSDNNEHQAPRSVSASPSSSAAASSPSARAAAFSPPPPPSVASTSPSSSSASSSSPRTAAIISSLTARALRRPSSHRPNKNKNKNLQHLMYVMHNSNNINGAEDQPADAQILMAKEEELKGEQNIKDEQLAKYTGESAEKYEINQKSYLQRQKQLSQEQARKKEMQSTEQIHKSQLMKDTQNGFDAVLDLKRQRQATLEEEAKQEYVNEGKEKELEAGNKREQEQKRVVEKLRRTERWKKDNEQQEKNGMPEAQTKSVITQSEAAQEALFPTCAGPCCYENAQYTGPNLSPMPQPSSSPQDCCTRCLSTQGCVFFAYSQSQNQCFLMTSKTNVNRNAVGFTSGFQSSRS